MCGYYKIVNIRYLFCFNLTSKIYNVREILQGQYGEWEWLRWGDFRFSGQSLNANKLEGHYFSKMWQPYLSKVSSLFTFETILTLSCNVIFRATPVACFIRFLWAVSGEMPFFFWINIFCSSLYNSSQGTCLATSVAIVCVSMWWGISSI